MRNLYVIGTLWVIIGIAAVSSAQGELEQTDLFEAGQGGYALYRIPGLVATPRGTLLAYCEARKNAKADWGHIDILMRRSVDGGKTWEPARQIVHLDGKFERNPAAVAQGLGKEGEITINNPVAIVDAKQELVHMLYCVEYNRLFHMTSNDDGKTFSKPVELTSVIDGYRPNYDWQSFAVGPGHGIQLAGGRLLAAIWLSTGKGGHAHRPSVVSTIYSDNGGKTWERGEIVAGEQRPLINPSESIVVELSDGRVMINMRSESKEHRRAYSISRDGSSGWSEPMFDEVLVEPVCMASIVRLATPERDGTTVPAIVFANPATEKGRKNLSIRLSRDDGITWPVVRVLEPGASAYSDLSVGPDNSIFCFYERGHGEGNAYRRLTLAKFDEEWIRGGGN
jgi:sialidase-1